MFAWTRNIFSESEISHKISIMKWAIEFWEKGTADDFSKIRIDWFLLISISMPCFYKNIEKIKA
jgi:hypothetical protein